MGLAPIKNDESQLFLYASSTAFFTVMALLYILTSKHTDIERAVQGAFYLGEGPFIDRWLDVSLGNLSDGYTLDHLCNKREVKWQKNLVVNVHDANGGIGNVRGNILDFVYFAIATGSSIILPGFAARSKTDPSALFDGRIPFDTFFDEDHFIGSIHEHCPQLHIYSPDQMSAMTTVEAAYISPSLRDDLSDQPSQAVNAFLKWLSEEQKVPLPPHKPTVVNLGRTLWDGPDTRTFTPKVRRDFGSLLKFHPTARELAALVTYNLAQRFSLDLDPNRLWYKDAYLGAHLRTEADAAKAGWLSIAHANFSAQTDAYIAQAKQKRLKIIYTASGSREDLEDFANKAWRQAGINVTHKHDLLDSTDLADLQGLSWDQQALVDYEVLLRSSYFGGFVKSSFSYNIAITRQAVMEMEGRVVEKRWSEIDPARLDFDEEKAFEDRLSIIWGRDDWHEKKIPRGSWP